MLVVMVVAVAVIATPLRRQRSRPAGGPPSPERAELEAAKEAKLREVREAELDHRLGKLSREDWRSLDATLRAEAIEILHRIDALDSAEDNES